MKPLQLSAVGITPTVGIFTNTPGQRTIRMPPSIIVTLTPGAVLTWTLEVTNDDPDQTGAFASPGDYNFYDGLIALTPTYGVYPASGSSGLSAPANCIVNGYVGGVRARILTYTSGTLNFQVGY